MGMANSVQLDTIKFKQGSYPDKNRSGGEENGEEYFHSLEGEGKTVGGWH